jgi:hypothetical protein
VSRTRVSTADAAALVDGRPVTDPSLEPVTALLTELRAVAGTNPMPAPSPALRSRLVGTRPLHVVPDPLDPTVAPGRRTQPGADGERSDPGCRRPRFRGLRPVAAAFATGAIAFGSLATAGALPAPLQRVSAELGRHVGIDLPRPADPLPAPRARVRISGSVPPNHRATASSRASVDTTPAGPAPSAPALPPPDATPVPTLPLPVPTPDAATTPDTVVPPPAPVDREHLRTILPDLQHLLGRP